MAAPYDARVLPRSEHTLSRKDIDPDALKILYRQAEFNPVVLFGDADTFAEIAD